MRVLVNGVRLFFDVEGASLVPDGPSMREKLLLLHGPGFDHSIYKPGLFDPASVSQLASWSDATQSWLPIMNLRIIAKAGPVHPGPLYDRRRQSVRGDRDGVVGRLLCQPNTRSAS